jgi:hypothetical protein
MHGALGGHSFHWCVYKYQSGWSLINEVITVVFHSFIHRLENSSMQMMGIVYLIKHGYFSPIMTTADSKDFVAFLSFPLRLHSMIMPSNYKSLGIDLRFWVHDKT